MDVIGSCFTLIAIFVVGSILWSIIQNFFHNTFGDTVEKKIANGGMKICPHCGNVVSPRGSICPVCQKNIELEQKIFHSQKETGFAPAKKITSDHRDWITCSYCGEKQHQANISCNKCGGVFKE